MIREHFNYLTEPKAFPGLDALRALAVSMVVLYHFQFLPIGWLGVDLFFVLSGFLVGGIILKAKERGDFTFGRFYWERFLRIAPVYYFAVAAYVGIYAVPSGTEITGTHLIAVLALFHTTAQYFFGAAIPHTITPGGTWSLVIEWQFYMLAPALMILAFDLLGRLGVVWLSISAVVSGPIVRYWMIKDFSPDDANWHFASSIQFHARYDELAIGVLLAAALPYVKLRPMIAAMISAVAFSAIMVALFAGGYMFAANTITREIIWLPSLYALCFSSLIIAAKDLKVSSPWVIALARLSYSLYLCHFIVLLVTHLNRGSFIVSGLGSALGYHGSFVALIGVSIALAYVVSLFVEYPFIRIYSNHRRVKHLR